MVNLLAMFGINHLLNLILICIESIITVGFLVIYFRRKNTVLKPLIWSVGLFLFSNIFSFVFYLIVPSAGEWSLSLMILAHLLIGGGLILLVHFLEMFENDMPFTNRSTIATILILFTGLLQMLSYFLSGSMAIIGILTPIPYFIVGILYLKFITRIRSRARFASKKSKITRVRSGVSMIFISPLIFYFVLGVLIFIGYLFAPTKPFIDIDRNPDSLNLGTIDPIVMLCQLVGILLISIPVLVTKSTFFMQSRKISRLIVINDNGLPIYDFTFDSKNSGDELLLSGALTAITSVMREATGASRDLKSIAFGDLHIITEVREGFAANLLVESSTAFLKEALRLFTDSFQNEYKSEIESFVIDPLSTKEADCLLQKYFGIESEELEEILAMQSVDLATPASD